MKKNFKKYLSILLVAVMAFTTLTLVACNPNSFGKDTDTEASKLSNSLSFETKNSPFLSLSATTATRATTNGNVLEHILTATVLPETAENKEVDWMVNWEDTSRQEIVSSYVMLTTQEDTSFTLTPKGDLTAILSAVYPGYTVADCNDHAYENMFTLIITSYNGEAEVRVNFTVTEDIQGVILDKEVIEF